MGSVGIDFVCQLCLRWRPFDGHPIVDKCEIVPFACGVCRTRLYTSAAPCWQAEFYYPPMQKLVFCNKNTIGGIKFMWDTILSFLPWVPPRRDIDMPCGVPLFLFYDDMVCHGRGWQDLWLRFPQLADIPVVSLARCPIAPLPEACPPRVPSALMRHRGRSAPAAILRPSRAPLVVKPAGAGASHFKVALGWPCKREDIWGLRREARYPDKGCGYRAWWRRKWQWQVDLEDAERLRLWELANSEELRLQVERWRAGSGEGSDSEVSATVVDAFFEPDFD